MTLTFCKIFHTIVQQGSFLKASEMLHMTPSAISHAVSDTEAQTGFQFFKRTRNGIVMTEYGKEIYPAILQLLNSEESLEQSIDQLRGMERGIVKIGVFNSVCTNWMPDILNIFEDKYPGIEIKIFEGGYDDVIEWIKNGTVDFGLLSTSCTTDLPVEPLCKDQLICLVQENFETRTPGIITIDEIKNQQFVIQSAGSDADVQMLFKRNNLHLHSSCHVLDDTSIIAMVGCGKGISVMPELTAKGIEGGLKVLKFRPEEYRVIGLSAIDRKNLSPAAKQLYNCIKNYALSKETALNE